MNRRGFLKNGTVLSAGVGLGLLACKNEKFVVLPVPEAEKIKIGIIGTGYRGKDILAVLKKTPEFKVIACCDVLDFRLEKAIEQLDERPKTYTDYRKLLENKDLDAVVISTPLHLHHQMVLDAMDANLHIMCEKALAHNIEQSKEIKIKGDQTTKLFQVSYQYQLNPTFNAIKELINEGHCGTITRIEGVWNRNSNWRRPMPSPELERQINWRMYKEYSGGLMAELGSHQLNMMDNIIGTHPTKVVGTGGIDYWKDGRETFDNVYAIFDYPNGIKASFGSNLANEHEGFQLTFRGDKATVITSAMDIAYIYPEGNADEDWNESIDGVTGASIKIIDKSRKRKITPIDEGKIYPFDNHFANTTWLLYKNFAAAIKGKEKLALGLKDGYQSAISVHMANDAIRNEKVVRWLPEYDV